MAALYANNASAILGASVTAVATLLTLETGQGERFPMLTGVDYFYATLSDPSGRIEIVRVSARAADTMTVVRGQDGTSALAWSAGDRLELRINRALLDALKADAKASLISADITNALGYTPYNAATNTVILASSIQNYAPTLAGLGATGTWAINISGNAASASAASRLATARTQTLTGDVTGLASFDGSTNWSLPTTLASSGVVAGTYSNASITVDAKGRITQASSSSPGGVTSVNGRTGAVALGSADITAALGFTPYNNTNPSGYLSSITSAQVTAALGYTPPQANGTGASGSWPISISGNASNISAFTVNQSVGTANAPTFADVYVNGWFRNNASGQGLYNQATSNHFYADGGYWNIGYAGTNGLRLRNGHNGTVMGSYYGETNGNSGLLNQNGNWKLRVNGSEMEFYDTSYANDFRAYVYYDRNDTTYFADLNSTGTSIRAAGNITAYYSDIRLKTVLGPIDEPLARIKSLQGFFFEANATAQALGYAARREVGIAAQDCLAALPEIVTEAPIDARYLTLDYARLTPLLIEGIKALLVRVEALEAQCAARLR